MKLDPEKFTTDESRSNHYIAAINYPDCPIGGICTYSGQDNCQYLLIIGESDAECTYGEEVVERG